MRRRRAMVIGLALAAVLAFVFLVPVVYSPPLEYVDISHPYHVPAYESLGCMLFGVGAGYSTALLPTYQLSCPPRVIIG